MNNHPFGLTTRIFSAQGDHQKIRFKTLEQSLPLHLMQNFLILENSPKTISEYKEPEIS
jgi:hypothetical protein